MAVTSYLQLLQFAVGAAVLAVVVKLLRFGAGYLRSRRQYETSTLSGPPLTHPFTGNGVTGWRCVCGCASRTLCMHRRCSAWPSVGLMLAHKASCSTHLTTSS